MQNEIGNLLSFTFITKQQVLNFILHHVYLAYGAFLRLWRYYNVMQSVQTKNSLLDSY